jgi:hypothetical protein
MGSTGASVLKILRNANAQTVLETMMLETPFRFEAGFTSKEFETIGRLALRWAAIEHFVANCLKAMLGLSDKQAIVMVFPLGMEAKLLE